MANLKPCMTDGYSGHETLEYLILSTLNKAAANGHRNEIKLDKFAKSLGCDLSRLRSSLRKLCTSGHINCATIIDWESIGSVQLGQPIVTCEPAQLSLGDRDGDDDEVTVAVSLDALTHTDDVDVVVDGRHLRFALRYSDDGTKAILTVSEAASSKAKRRDAIIDGKEFDDRAAAIAWAKEYAGELAGSGGD